MKPVVRIEVSFPNEAGDCIPSPCMVATQADLRELRDAVKALLLQAKGEIMSAISDFAASVQTAFTTIGTDVDALQASVTGIAGDVQRLKALIEQLQNSPGAITPEDQALLDQLQATVTGAASKVAAAKEQAATLDAETAPDEVPTPPEPPPA